MIDGQEPHESTGAFALLNQLFKFAQVFRRCRDVRPGAAFHRSGGRFKGLNHFVIGSRGAVLAVLDRINDTRHAVLDAGVTDGMRRNLGVHRRPGRYGPGFPLGKVVDSSVMAWASCSAVSSRAPVRSAPRKSAVFRVAPPNRVPRSVARPKSPPLRRASRKSESFNFAFRNTH